MIWRKTEQLNVIDMGHRVVERFGPRGIYMAEN